MCGLFGFIVYNKKSGDYTKLLNALATESAERGTHATGIAYNKDNNLTIYKRPLPAYKMKFKHIEGVKVITGHTRHATQGDIKNNYNNHPFEGNCNGLDFAMAHNGIIYNDTTLRRAEKLPDSKIKTDSYIYTQLIENEKNIDFDTLAKCTEKLQGYYTFTILDNRDNLYIIKGESPIAILHLTRLKMYVYASTDSILYRAIIDGGLLEEIKSGHFETIKATDGDILKISPDGTITRGKFESFDYSDYNYKKWYEYTYIYDDTGEAEYLQDIKQIAGQFGYSDDDIDELIADGFTLDDIEEYLYNGAYL